MMGNNIRYGSSYYEAIKLILRFIVAIVVYTTVNNGNILIDGSDEKKYLQKKYNEL